MERERESRLPRPHRDRNITPAFGEHTVLQPRSSAPLSGGGGVGGVTCGHAHNNHQYVHYDSHYHTAKHILKQEAEEGDF